MGGGLVNHDEDIRLYQSHSHVRGLGAMASATGAEPPASSSPNHVSIGAGFLCSGAFYANNGEAMRLT